MSQLIQCDGCKRWAYRYPEGSTPQRSWRHYYQRHVKRAVGGEWRLVGITPKEATSPIILDACCDGCEEDIKASVDGWTIIKGK